MSDNKKLYTMTSFGKKADLPKGAPFELIVDSSAPEQQLVFGWANVSVLQDGDIPFDWHEDMIPTSVLENAAYNYVLNFSTSGQEHQPDTECGHLIESMMFTKEKAELLGVPPGILPEGWWIGFYVPDPEIFKLIKDGTYNMFSIQGECAKQVL